MSNKNDRWSALSLKDRADLMDMYIKNGISELSKMKKHYNGIPYKDLNTSEYDYFNASPEMIPTQEGQHWDTRNPHTGQILKREDHHTFDLGVQGEQNAGYKIVRNIDGNLYSIPNYPNNYVEDYNSFSGEENQNNEEVLYYDDIYIEPAVVKAFASNEDYNRYYGEQFGKKVAKGMNNAAPYVLEAAMLPFTISGAVETPMLLYQGVKAAPQLVKGTKTLLTKGKKAFGKKVLGMVEDMNDYIKEGSHFRIVDKPAIDDAVESGVIRSKTGLHHDAVTYLKDNFQKYLDDIPGWERMEANELRGLLDKRGAFKAGGDDLKREALLQIRNSTNHGGSVHYFRGMPYPNYQVTAGNYVIETPESIGSFVAGHGGKEFVDIPLEHAGATLLKTNGSIKGASIPSKGSSYWEYSPFWEMWKKTKFENGGRILSGEKTCFK